MKTKNLEKLFDQFLVENDCFDEFMCEFHYQHIDNYDWLMQFPSYMWVDRSLKWVYTYQGYGYWQGIHCKWQKYLKENL
jgi:Zn-finger protein